MNQSRFATLAGAAAALATHMALASGAQAKVTEIESGGVTAVEDNGVLTELYDLPVDGTPYDVTFSSSGMSGGTLFPSAEDATVALANELQSLGFPFVEDCPTSVGWSCSIFTRTKPGHNVVMVYLNVTGSTVDPAPRGLPLADQAYAVWTAGSPPPTLASVPEPPPAALLGIGVAGVAAARALSRKKKKSG